MEEPSLPAAAAAALAAGAGAEEEEVVPQVAFLAIHHVVKGDV